MLSNFRPRNRAGYQCEFEMYQKYCTGDESELPPPNTQSHNRLGDNNSAAEVISYDVFRDELDFDYQIEKVETNSCSVERSIKQKLINDSINPEALPSGEDRVKSIQQVMTIFTAQVVVTSIFTIWLLNFNTEGSVYLRLTALCCLIAAALAFNKYGTVLSPLLMVLCFGVFSVALPYTMTLVACLMDSVVLTFLLIQVSVMSLGLCLYTWTTKYENWNGKEELIFAVTPIIFASVIMILLFAASPLAVVLTGGLSILLGILVADCYKDNIVPAKSLDQLLSDALDIHFNIVRRAAFLFKVKLLRLARKANWF